MTPTPVIASPDGVPGAVTDPSTLEAENITFAAGDRTQINGYLARPNAPATLPAVIVIHEAFGVNDHIRDVTNRFANLGYVALAVDLYTRYHGPPAPGDFEALRKQLYAMSDAHAISDLEGAADYLRSRDDVDGRVGCVGFCMGGRYALLFADSSDRLDAAIDCWGGFISRSTLDQISTPQRPTPPLELAHKLTCPLLAAVGAEDQDPSPEIAQQLAERAGRSGWEVKVDVYEDAGHAFFADYRPDFYRPAAAAKLWQEIVPFFARHLKDA